MITGINTTGIGPRNTGCMPMRGPVKEIIQPVEVPIAAFPLRGRFNPYFKYLLPLIILRFLILLALLGALISAVIIPRVLANFNNEASQETQDTRVAAIVIFSIAIAVTITLLLLEILNLCNVADSKFVSILISLLDLFFALLILGISIPLIVLESITEAIPALYVNAIDFGTLRAAGILGLIAVLFLLFHLFFSRFYQFCIGNYKSFKREFLTGSLPYSTGTTTCQTVCPTGLNGISSI
ncbi:hypothetical protein BpHYR1_050123 [Brachionus plicatilis]|uniref:MARVEL domain-containing protein n=1 Tax=Brachionus plicatilis TaxID=10195 RepID=A0A3M7RK55_BRAPC|nr:hypothetical protein BpHYR1_050123 [Brachionus plicatilis]